ncbi:hypothetical protein O3Q51_09975 [Cryomorphaceae bacterium 1068]|nr:hypothetical protein [Cryomorphaceae bacterium 1068]
MRNKPFIQSGFFGFSFLFLFSLAAVFLTGFETSKKGEPAQFKIPFIKGITDTTTLCLSPEYMLNAWYRVERMDSIADTLDLSGPSKHDVKLSFQFFMPTEIADLPRSNHGLQVIVDTINELSMTKKPIWASYLFYRFFDDSVQVLQDDTLIQHVKSFPIYVANVSEDAYAQVTLQDKSLILIVEAKDTNGDWKPIEYWSNSWCGNSYFEQLLPPKHMMISRGIKCSGDFHTRCRLKLTTQRDSVYSNEFSMSINETQFTNPLQKDG